MTKALEFSGTVVNGKLPQKVSEQIMAVLRSAEGKRVTVSIREQKRVRSLSANAYYWGVVIPPIVAMFRDEGNMVDAEDTHEFLKEHVGKVRQVIVTPDGEVVRAAGSTAKLSTAEFGDYVAKIKAWAAEFGIHIPEPGEPAET